MRSRVSIDYLLVEAPTSSLPFQNRRFVDLEAYPELVLLKNIGATDEVIKACQRGFDIFKLSGLEAYSTDLFKGYQILLASEKVDEDYISLLHMYAAFKIRNGKSTNLDLQRKANEIVFDMEKGKSPREIWIQMLGEIHEE